MENQSTDLKLYKHFFQVIDDPVDLEIHKRWFRSQQRIVQQFWIPLNANNIFFGIHLLIYQRESLQEWICIFEILTLPLKSFSGMCHMFISISKYNWKLGTLKE